MTVKITYPKQGKGDQTLVCELDEAKEEVEEAVKKWISANL